MPKKRGKQTEPVDLRDDPRVRDVGIWQTMKIMIEEGAIDRAWRVQLYKLHRSGWLTHEQREAGDRYHNLTYDFRSGGEHFDPEETKKKYNRAICILGLGRKAVDSLVLDNEYLTEREKYIARDGLQLLANFFGLGKNKRATNT